MSARISQIDDESLSTHKCEVKSFEEEYEHSHDLSSVRETKKLKKIISTAQGKKEKFFHSSDPYQIVRRVRGELDHIYFESHNNSKCL